MYVVDETARPLLVHIRHTSAMTYRESSAINWIDYFYFFYFIFCLFFLYLHRYRYD